MIVGAAAEYMYQHQQRYAVQPRVLLVDPDLQAGCMACGKSARVAVRTPLGRPTYVYLCMRDYARLKPE